jgi:hypothetical protein
MTWVDDAMRISFRSSNDVYIHQQNNLQYLHILHQFWKTGSFHFQALHDGLSSKQIKILTNKLIPKHFRKYFLDAPYFKAQSKPSMASGGFLDHPKPVDSLFIKFIVNSPMFSNFIP